MKFLIDMNLSPLWVQFLAGNGIEGTHWSTIGKSNAPDSEILKHAASSGFIVFTHDLDFGMLLAASKGRGSSVLQIRTQDVLPASIGGIVLQAIVRAGEHLEVGAIVSVDLAQHRIRLLPI